MRIQRVVVFMFLFAVLLLSLAGCASPSAGSVTGAVVSPTGVGAAEAAPATTTAVATVDTVATTDAVATTVAAGVAAGVAATVAAQGAIADSVAATVAAQVTIEPSLEPPTAVPTATAVPAATATPTLTPTETPSPTPCVWTVTAKLNANVRGGPDTVYDQIGALRAGETATVIGRSEDGAWSVIDQGGRQGWIADSVTTRNVCPGAPPPPVPAPPRPTPSPTPVVTYQSCAEIRAARPDAGDGFYTLYLGGNINRPYSIYCHTMAGSPAEYLSLVNTGEGGASNYSMLKVGGATEGEDQYEYFFGIRLNPFTLEVDRADYTFTTMVGRFQFKPAYEDTHDWRRTQYGEARSCIKARDESSRANVDLRGTPFAVHPSVVDVPLGFLPAGRTFFSPDRKVVDLQGGGFCGGLQLKPLFLEYVGR